jgi:hypothetical protein
MSFKNWTEADVQRFNARSRGNPPPDDAQGLGKPVEHEADLHDDIEAYCKGRGWIYRHDRMDRPTTGQVGWPDFVIFGEHPKIFIIEAKAKGGKLTLAQQGVLAWFKKLGWEAQVFVVQSFDGFLAAVEPLPETPRHD